MSKVFLEKSSVLIVSFICETSCPKTFHNETRSIRPMQFHKPAWLIELTNQQAYREMDGQADGLAKQLTERMTK